MTFSNSPSQKFKTVLNDNLFNIEVNWNARFEFWVMDIKDEEREFLGIKLVSGLDILQPFAYFDFTLISNALVDPTRFDLDTFDFEVTSA